MAERKLHLDFETRSVAKFGKQGGKRAVNAQQYARHPTTEIRHACYAFNDGPVQHWHAWRGDPVPDDLLGAVADGWIVGAHNAGFEQAIWEHVMVPVFGAPPLRIEQMDCTAARAAIMALPRDLGGVAAALGFEQDLQKDKDGHAVMLKVSKPRAPKKATKAREAEDPDGIYWEESEELMLRQAVYCERDVDVERAVDKALKPMTRYQREQWLRVHRANLRGVLVDIEYVRKARKVVEVMDASYSARFLEETGGVVTSATDLHGLKRWLIARGHEITSLDKTSVIHLLEHLLKVDKEAAHVLKLRQEAGKSSVAKLDRFLILTDEQRRMLENFLFHAANTGRLGGRGAQLQNLPSRGGLKWYSAQECIRIILETEDPEWAAMRIELLYGEIPTALSSALRGIIMAPEGSKLFVADFSNIEGRVGAWLADEKWKLQAFKDYDTPVLDLLGNRIPDKADGFKRVGADLYKITAGRIIGKPPSDITYVERNVLGKVSELSLLFGGGAGAYVSMGKNYNVDMADYWDIIRETLDDQFIAGARRAWIKRGQASGQTEPAYLAAESVKLAWRDRHPMVLRAWAKCEDLSIQALKNPGKWFAWGPGKTAVGCDKIAGRVFLIYRLPSGRKLYRCDAHLKAVKKFGRDSSEIRFKGVDADSKRWVNMNTYGGDTFQSYVQAVAYDLMDHGWANVEDDGFEVVLSVHDEIGAEGSEDWELDRFIDGMNRTPEWAAGCPVSSAGYTADRYRKD